MGRKRSSPNPVVTSIKLDEATRDSLKAIAADSGLSFGALLRRILDGYVAGKGGPEIAAARALEQRKALEEVQTLADTLAVRIKAL